MEVNAIDKPTAYEVETTNKLNFCRNLVMAGDWRNWTTNPYCVGVTEQLARERIKQLSHITGLD